MCNNKYVKNGAVVACPICKCNYQIGGSHSIFGSINGNFKSQIEILICPNCYKKATGIESCSLNIEEKQL